MNAYETITASIVAAIEANPGAWKRPWVSDSGYAASPVNIASKRAYRGINTLQLWSASQLKGYTSADWGTYKQWSERGCQVRKGEKCTTVVFWKFFDKTRETEDGDEKCGSIPMARMYSVFNGAQCEGYSVPDAPAVTEERIAHAEAFYRAQNVDIRHGGNRAYYTPAGDYIQMPTFAQFATPLDYYGTLAHEVTHWTGPRLERDLKGRFGSESYAMEELVAEIGAAFALATIGLSATPREDHAAYVASWLRVIKSDSRAIFTAASKAQQACDWLVERACVREEVIAA